jgi:5-formyltetrahydrofolate cyclo-ligase
MDLRTRKTVARREVAAAIAAIPKGERAAMDARIVEQAMDVLGLFLTRPRVIVAGYMPLPDEPEITPLLLEFFEHGARLVFPRMERDGDLSLHEVKDFASDLAVGSYGILEPAANLPTIAPASVSLALVPGRALSASGARLGRGRGCYDRLLQKMIAKRVALAYDCQILEDLPADESDEPMNVIITPTRVIEAADR